MRASTEHWIKHCIDMTNNWITKPVEERNKIYRELLDQPNKAILYINHKHDTIRHICKEIMEDVSNETK